MSVFVEGECECGDPDNRITIISGGWRMNSASTQFVPCTAWEEAD